MRKYLIAGAAAFSTAVLPNAIFAQADVPGSTNTVDDKRSDHAMTPQQQSMYDAWPTEQRADYDTWAPDYQVYFWSLDPAQQEGYWALTPEQRTRIYAMAPEQREQAWNSVVAQLGQTNPAQMAPKPSAAGNVRFVSEPVVQNIPPAHQGEYPVCKSDQDRNCINAWEAGKRGAGVNKPLDYWPGETRSPGD